MGYRASMLALKLLGLEGKNISSTHTVIVENDVCGVDGVQFVTGCTVGNSGLIIDNQGRQAFNFVSKSGRGIRIALKYPLWGSNYPIELHQKVKTGTASEAEKTEFFPAQRAASLYQLDEELFKVSEIELHLPSPGSIPLRCAISAARRLCAPGLSSMKTAWPVNRILDN